MRNLLAWLRRQFDLVHVNDTCPTLPGPLYIWKERVVGTSRYNDMAWWPPADQLPRYLYSSGGRWIFWFQVPRHVRQMLSGAIICHECQGTRIDRVMTSIGLGEVIVCPWCKASPADLIPAKTEVSS